MTSAFWIFEILFFIITGANGLSHFPPNFVVVKMNDQTVLTCNTSTNETVVWKFDNDIVERHPYPDNFEQVGQNLIVSDIDTPVLGEYSCWRGDKLLSSTYLLQEDEETQKADSPLTCWAKSYDCKFNCNWTGIEHTVVRLGLGHDCSQGGSLCQWVNSKEQAVDGGFQFEVSHYLSPYAEETTMLEVTAEAIAGLTFLRTTQRFYLRDIIEPDSPQIGNCQEVGDYLNVSIDPPSSWSTPHSFFGLEHEIEYMLKDDGKTGISPSTVIPKKISKLRARSRDALVLSHWSQWTPWKNVKTGVSKLCKCKNKEKYCCPELPPGYLDQCKKKRKNKSNKDIEGNQKSSKRRHLEKTFMSNGM
ncbi:interleukin-12 subunit beta isoform X2 [Channa argus]|uniref:interleukin-12 subunit beta isoform X2 n=1 Tax=Channa argus TaxID=215402 RepID=UPI0035206FF7